MSTRALGVNPVDFTLDPNSAAIINFPVTDQLGASLNVTSGWTVKAFHCLPQTNPNPHAAPIDLAAVGTFTFGNGFVQWNIPNNSGLEPQSLANSYVLMLSQDGGVTCSRSNDGTFTLVVESFLLPV